MTKVEIIEAIGSMTVLELSELIKEIEEKFGVSAAPVAAAVAAPTAVAPQEDEKTDFTVVLSSFGDNKVAVIKVVRQITGLGLKEAKDLVEGVPNSIKENIERAEADEIAKQLQEAGATCEIK